MVVASERVRFEGTEVGPEVAVDNSESCLEFKCVVTKAVDGRDMFLGSSGRVRFRVRVGGVTGKEVDASKLDEMLGEGMNSESTMRRMRRRMIAKRTGMRIWKAVTTLRRFCSIQFFQSNSPNCAVFDIAMLSTTRCCKLQQTQPRVNQSVNQSTNEFMNE